MNIIWIVKLTLGIIAGIPLLAYPFVLLANVMSLAGQKDPNVATVTYILMYSFLAVTTLYPFIYVWCMRKLWYNQSWWFAGMLYLYLVAIFALFNAWQQWS